MKLIHDQKFAKAAVLDFIRKPGKVARITAKELQFTFTVLFCDEVYGSLKVMRAFFWHCPKQLTAGKQFPEYCLAQSLPHFGNNIQTLFSMALFNPYPRDECSNALMA